jgi:hypothetical protein
MPVLTQPSPAHSRPAAGSDPSGRTWQPWADYLVGIVVLALPWSGKQLQAAAPQATADLLVSIAEYVEVRGM